MIDVTAADEISNDARARSNVVRLAAAQALTGANSAVIFATGSIIGATLAPDISLATVPLSMYVVGIAAVLVRAAISELRLVGGQHGGIPAGRAGAGRVGVGVIRQKAGGVATGYGISGSAHLGGEIHAVASPSR